MKLKQIYKKLSFEANSEQDSAIREISGLQLIIAGPGAGKTQVLILGIFSK